MTKDVSFSGRPPSSDQRAEKAFAALQTTEAKVEEPTKRVCVDLPVSLHSRIKVGCAKDGVSITQILRDYLEKKFPEID